MKGILTDSNAVGHVKVLLYVLESDAWRDVWAGLNVPMHSFAHFELPTDASDADIWHLCQQEELIFITNNRNADGPDSLEETIRTHNGPEHLPVFTISNAEKIRHSRDYAERVVERMLEYLMDIDSYRGTGRLFLP